MKKKNIKTNKNFIIKKKKKKKAKKVYENIKQHSLF